jgi:hypothetical protein
VYGPVYAGKAGVGFILLSQVMLKLMLRLAVRGLREGEKRVRSSDSLKA